MGKCIRNTKTVLKSIAKTMGAQLLAEAGRAVQFIEDMHQENPEWFTSEQKRAMAVAAVKASARRLKRDVPAAMIGATIEYAVVALQDSDPEIKPTDMGDVADDEIEKA